MTAYIRKDQSRSSLKDLGEHFLYLDSQMVEAYCGCSDEGFSAKERVEILEDEAFLFYIRKLT